MTPARHPSWGFALATVGYMAWIFHLSSLPGSATGPDTPVWRFASNLFHVPLFAGLGVCLAMTLGQWPWPARGLWTMGAGLAFAGLDEWHQSWIPGRSASVGDIAMDGIGLALALSGLWWLSRRRATRAEMGVRWG
jgi:VanZ family protein